MSVSLVGQQLGNYNVKSLIGEGAMATVYLAADTLNQREVALKVLPATYMHDLAFYERFMREIAVINSLDHPHIVPIYDHGKFDNIPYIAMRYLSGGTMRQLLDRGPAKISQLVQPIKQTAAALDYAHTQGIIHRDLKPDNILYDGDGNVYLTDFGIARVVDSSLTGSAVIGTPTYMSPEQAEGIGVDGRTDQYAMAIVIFELITGREPFEADNPIAMIVKHIKERVPLLSEFRENIPLELDKVIAKATEKKPEDRYANLAEMAAAFETAVKKMQVN